MFRRLALTAAASAAASLAVLAAAPPAAYAEPLPSTPFPHMPPAPERDRDRLTVTVSDAGDGLDGTYELECHPEGGSHPDARGACERLDRRTGWGEDPFAPIEPKRMCTMQYGGPATARVTGTWAGRPVNVSYTRGDGCEIARWDAMVPVLPKLGS